VHVVLRDGQLLEVARTASAGIPASRS
jgi:hypothetical protein